jgi:hypothetical protein
LKEYYPADKDSGTRSLDKIIWIVEHVAESSSARATARWFQNPDAQGSTHLTVGQLACYRSLPNEAVPWGAKGANTAGFHIEHEGWASWSRTKWLTERDTTLRRGAYKTAYHCHLFDIPPVLLKAADLKLRKPGVTTHHECVVAFGGTHTCPGPNFPLDKYMSYVKQYYRELAGV